MRNVFQLCMETQNSCGASMQSATQMKTNDVVLVRLSVVESNLKLFHCREHDRPPLKMPNGKPTTTLFHDPCLTVYAVLSQHQIFDY